MLSEPRTQTAHFSGSPLKPACLRKAELQQLSCHERPCWGEQSTQLVVESSKGHITSNSCPLCDSTHVCDIQQNCREEIRNRTGLGFGHWWAHTSSHVAGRSLETLRNKGGQDWAARATPQPTALWRSNEIDSNNWKVYRFWSLLKHRSQKQNYLVFCCFFSFPSTETPSTSLWALDICLTSWFPSSSLILLLSQVLVLVPQLWHIPHLSACSPNP